MRLYERGKIASLKLTNVTAKTNILAYVSERVSATPGGLVRSFERAGHHRVDSCLDLWKRSGAIASTIARAGISPGSPIVIVADRIGDFLPAFWACLRADTIAVPLTTLARTAVAGSDGSFDEALVNLESPCVIIDAASRGIADRRSTRNRKIIFLDQMTPAGDWTDTGRCATEIACVLPTSGSTGTVKLAKLSHAALIHRYLQKPALRPHSLGVFPLDSVTGHQAVYLRHQTWTQIPRDVLIERPTAILDAIETFGIAFVNLSTSIINQILMEDAKAPRFRNLACIKLVGIGGEPISSHTARDFAALMSSYGAANSVLCTGYGTTETGPLVMGSTVEGSSNPEDIVSLGSPRPQIQMRIVDDNGEVLPAGEIGELHVKCPEVMFSGYWGEPDGMSSALTADGWWCTGDLGRLRDGKLSLHGRTKHVLIVNGRKFSLGEIDQAMLGVLQQGEIAFSCVLQSAQPASERLGIGFCTDAPTERAGALARALRVVILERFGLLAGRIVRLDRLPQTAGGKLDRKRLAEDILQRKDVANTVPLPDASRAVEAIWCGALGIPAPADPGANFYDLGGDSLRALALYSGLIDSLGIHIEADLFFVDPTLRHLKRLVDAQSVSLPASSSTATAGLRWPLPEELRGRLMTALAGWPGERVTPSRMLLRNQIWNSRPPMFWILNTKAEAEWLATALGDQQPLYVFRSAGDIADQNEDTIQAFALRYLADMEEALPNGPFVIGGHCQAGQIALAIAQHALRRGHHVPLLVLLDWAFPPQPYSGRVVLISGHRNSPMNAHSRFAVPAIAWRRAFIDFESIELNGSFALDAGSLHDLGSAIREQLDAAIAAPTDFLPERSRRASINARVPRYMIVGRRSRIVVSIKNDSDQTWLGTDRSGLTVGYRWTDNDGDVIDTKSFASVLPDLGPRSHTKVVVACKAPSSSGEYLLSIEVCEQGRRWFRAPGVEGFAVPVQVGQSRVTSLARNIGRLVSRQRVEFDESTYADELSYAFDLKSDALDLLVSGWCSPEAWGTWSDTGRAKLRLPMAGIRGRWLAVVKCQCFGAPATMVALHVQVAGRLDETWTMPANSIGNHAFDFQAEGEDIVVTFLTTGTISPRELGISEDKRKLGIGLVSVNLKRLQAARTAEENRPESHLSD